MKVPFTRLIPVVLLFCSNLLHAQTAALPLVSGEFRDISVSAFIEKLEKELDYRFYYDLSEADTARINLSASGVPLDSLLGLAFQGHGIYYSLDPWGRVFITRKKPVVTSLSAGWLGLAPSLTQKPQLTASGTTEEEKPAVSVQQATLEHKLYEIGDKSSPSTQSSFILAGNVLDAKTGEPVAGASVYVEKLGIGTVTDQYGYYAISVPRGRHILGIQSIGMRDTRRQIAIYGEGKMNIDLQGQVMTLKRVIVSAQKLNNVRSTQMGVQKIDIKTIRQVPVAFGEADLIKVMLTLPGVKSVGESSTGLNVRGGSTDQNLILFNDATIYNPSHFFGLFSAFNPEVVKDVQLYKSSIPASYGGRLSSVLDITGREGNKKEYSGSAGIGLLTSRLELEGPLKKDKSSFILGGRTTYANWLLNALPEQYKNSRASFYDFNLNISHEIDRKNSLYVTGYMSRDRFNLNSDTLYGYGNQNISLKWKHGFSNKLNLVLTTGFDRYNYDIASTKNPLKAYDLSFSVNQSNLKAKFNYFLSSKHTLEFGLSSIYYKLLPGSYLPKGSSSLVISDRVNPEKALESALFISDRYAISPALSLEGGIRFSLYDYLGPQTLNIYAPGLPRTTDNVTTTRSYSPGAIINTYSGPEYRISARYSFSDSFSVKAGFNTQRQYIHLLSNTAAMAPTDIWKLSDPYVKPQHGDQFSLGFYKNLKSNTIEVSVEVYYRNIRDYLDYKSGANLVMNHNIETDVFNTRGKAYGAELLIKKMTGKLNGWISYAYSRTFSKMDDPLAGEIINGGQYYPTSYDIPHEATLVGNYRFTHRYSFSFNATYNTGRPITIPIANFYYSGSERTLYGDRNGYRIPYYFRSDASLNIDGNHKVHQKTHNSWTLGVYNLTGRKNPYSVYFISENGAVSGYKLSVFGSAIPYINFNIRF